MTAILKVDTIQDTSGNNIINESSDTITIGASGDTTNIVGTLQNNGSALVTGKILQVVSAVSTTQVTVTGTTFTDSGLSAAITPSSSSNKILVLVNQQMANFSSSAETGGSYKLLRGSSTIYGGAQNYQLYIEATGASAVQLYYPANLNFLDSPSSTSELTYKTQIRQYQNGDTIRSQPDSMHSSITLMEVAG